ncbi:MULTISPECIES: hypothetical protein [Pseudomonas]|uniref:hypothetical protein n=1 Tax=Pseudomonas TaxID=286 RepID=UPI001554E2D1|nr:hypothetical protein [Pseudomonas tumuqii]
MRRYDPGLYAGVEVQRRMLDYPGGAQSQPRAGLQGADGAPNSVLGDSRSGKIAAELAQYDRLGILSRDYYSASLLQAVWLLVDEDDGYDLLRAKSALACLPIR